jgi:type III restriction enzyme
MSNPFFDHPILNSPYDCPSQHWELNEDGQPTEKVLQTRRRAQFISPIPKPKKRKTAAKQQTFVFDDGKGLSTREQQYDPTSIINEVRGHVDSWRSLPNPNQWQVTPETARLLQYWRHHRFSGVRRSSVRWKRWKRRSGSPRWRRSPDTANAFSITSLRRTGMPIPSCCASP